MFYFRRAPADTPSDVRRPLAFCAADLPHFYAAYGHLVLVFKLAGLRLYRSGRRALPYQAPRWGAAAQAYECTSPEGVEGTGATAGFATPERERCTSTDAPVAFLGGLRGWGDCEQGPASWGPQPNRRLTP